VKVVLGFVEVALAFKFLSTADLVGNWDLLRIEPFLIVWILCALGIAAYLLGFISFPLDSKNRKKSPLGIALAVGAQAGNAGFHRLLLRQLPQDGRARLDGGKDQTVPH